MAREKKKTEKAGENVVEYRHKSVKRLNIPPAGLTARGEIVRSTDSSRQEDHFVKFCFLKICSFYPVMGR